MRPLVELSWLVTGCEPSSSGRMRLGQLLAQLHAPLVEAVDVPDDALDEDLVLVERDQRAEAFAA